MFGKDFTDPSTLLVAIGITVIVSVVEEDTKWRLYRRNSRYYYLWFSDGAGFPPMIVGTLVDPMATLFAGDVVSAMLIAREGKKVVKIISCIV
jgi:hypothetical protein